MWATISPLHQRLKNPPALCFEEATEPGFRPVSPVAVVLNKVFLACLIVSRAIFPLAEEWATPGGRQVTAFWELERWRLSPYAPSIFCVLGDGGWNDYCYPATETETVPNPTYSKGQWPLDDTELQLARRPIWIMWLHLCLLRDLC